MPLKLVLRPGEKMIINGAVIGVGEQTVSLFFYNTVNFLRGREILKEENCDTIEKKLYFIIQLIYIFPEDAKTNLIKFQVIFEEARASFPDQQELFSGVFKLVAEGNYYRALKQVRKLFTPDPTAAAPKPEALKAPVAVTRPRRRTPEAE